MITVAAGNDASAIATPGLPWIQQPSESPCRARLFCFPSAGGAASMFWGWRTRLPGIAMAALQLPGREGRIREAPLQTMNDVVDHVIKGLEANPTAPFCFFGYSLGALIAFETAGELHRRGLPLPRRLFVAAAANPGTKPTAEHCRSRLPDGELLQEIQLSGMVPDFVLRDAAIMQAVLPMIRADFEVLESYQPQSDATLPVPIVAYGGLEDRYISPESVAAWCWRTASSFRMRFFPGSHYFLRSSGDALLDDLAHELALAN